tara:strand:+ start:30 stop:650 length:621 start_codon:yes stop_codon:yes gene_type:complete
MGKREIETSSKYLNRIQDRLIDELIGISRGVIADGIVDESEAIFLGQWIENHREVADRWPANVLYARLVEMLKDGVLDADEQRELLETLMDITGGNSVYQESSRSTTLPVTQPQPDITFDGSVFCLTGRFVFRSKMECEEIIVDLGGVVIPAPTTDTDYLLIGEVGSPDWAHSTFGRSIEKAIELQGHGHPISIVSEEHWVNQLPE